MARGVQSRLQAAGWVPLTCALLPTSAFGSQNLTTVKLRGVGESFQKHPDYESKGIKAHFNLDESGVLSLDRVSAERTRGQGRAPAHRLSQGLRREKGLGLGRPWPRMRLAGAWRPPRGLPVLMGAECLGPLSSRGDTPAGRADTFWSAVWDVRAHAAAAEWKRAGSGLKGAAVLSSDSS